MYVYIFWCLFIWCPDIFHFVVCKPQESLKFKIFSFEYKKKYHKII